MKSLIRMLCHENKDEGLGEGLPKGSPQIGPTLKKESLHFLSNTRSLIQNKGHTSLTTAWLEQTSQ